MNSTAVIAHGAFVIMALFALAGCSGGGGSSGGAVGIESVSMVMLRSPMRPLL